MSPPYHSGNDIVARSSKIYWLILSIRMLLRDEHAIQSIAALLCFGAGIYMFLTTAALVIHGWSAVTLSGPMGRAFFNPKKILSPWIYSRHNEHRILFPRLIFAIDTFAFSG